MPTYLPILKAKPAELSAWEHTTAAERAAASPLFELAPSENLDKYLITFVKSAEKSLVTGEVVAVDASEVDQDRPWDRGKPRIIGSSPVEWCSGW